MGGSDSYCRFLSVVGILEHKMNIEGRKRKRPDWRDWDHLYGHYIAGRTAFLTWDQLILDAAPELRSGLGVVVMKPEEFLSQMS